MSLWSLTQILPPNFSPLSSSMKPPLLTAPPTQDIPLCFAAVLAKRYLLHPTHRQKAGKDIQICDHHSVLQPNVWVDLHFSKEELSRETSWLQLSLMRTRWENLLEDIFSIDDQCEAVCFRLYRKTGMQPAPEKGKSGNWNTPNIVILFNLYART